MAKSGVSDAAPHLRSATLGLVVDAGDQALALDALTSMPPRRTSLRARIAEAGAAIGRKRGSDRRRPASTSWPRESQYCKPLADAPRFKVRGAPPAAGASRLDCSETRRARRAVALPRKRPRPVSPDLSPQGAFAKRLGERLFESLTFRLRSPVFLRTAALTCTRQCPQRK